MTKLADEFIRAAGLATKPITMNFDLADEIIRLGREMSEERDAAFDLWSWLPSKKVAEKHHGDYACNFTPSI